MIKLNLLPQYVVEARRIRTVIVIFLVLLGLEAGVVYQAFTDLRKREVWFNMDKNYFTQRTTKIAGVKMTRDNLKGQSAVYRPYIDFFTRNAIMQYNDAIATSLEEVARTIGGGRAWFNTLTVNKDGSVLVTGQIRGLLNFLDYYYRMKDVGYAIVPAAQPASSPSNPTLNQLVPINMAGTVQSKLPDKPAAPGEAPVTPDKLYIPAGGGGAPAAPPAGGPPG